MLYQNLKNQSQYLKSKYFKLDIFIFPFLLLAYLFCVVDKLSIGYAITLNDKKMIKDLDLSNSDNHILNKIGFSLSIVYIGYLLFEIPFSMVMQKIFRHLDLWICFLVFGFGVTNIIQGFTSNFLTLLLGRFILGSFESGVFPAIVYYLSFFYTKNLLAKRICLFTLFSQLGSSLCGFYSYFIANKMDLWLGLDSWRWCFIMFGIPSVIVAFLSLIFLPKVIDVSQPSFMNTEISPGDYVNFKPITLLSYFKRLKFLSLKQIDELKNELEIEYYKRNEEYNGTKTNTWTEELWLVLMNKETYMYLIIFLLTTITVFSISMQLPSIIKSNIFNLENKDLMYQNLLLSSPPFIFSGVYALITGILSDILYERGYVVSFDLFVGVFGMLFFIIFRNGIFRYILLFVIIPGPVSAMPIIITWLANNSRNKLQTAINMALIVFSGNLGGVLGSFLYADDRKDSDVESYFYHNLANLIILTIAFVLSILLRFYLKKLNHKLIKEDYYVL